MSTFQRNMLPPSSELRCAGSGTSRLQGEGMKRETWPKPMEKNGYEVVLTRDTRLSSKVVNGTIRENFF
jgi:hypothetical protein